MSPTRRRRLDEALVELGLAPDLDAATELVGSGVVVVGGAPALSPARAVAPSEAVRVLVPPRFVSRGGDKLDAALERFAVDVAGRTALDVGASTGGFTDCLLERGASRVLAVDVGHSQLHERLRRDPRVVVRERTNVRDLSAEALAAALGGPAGVVTADVSFTSLAPHAPTLVALAEHGASVVVLVKPQFEADRVTASREHGVIRDPVVWRSALERCASALGTAGAGIMDAMASPITGSTGNVEFFLHARASTPSGTDVARAIDAALAEAPGR